MLSFLPEGVFMTVSGKDFGQRVEKRGRQVKEVVGYLEESSNAMAALLNKISLLITDFKEGKEGFSIPLEGFHRGLLAREENFLQICEKISPLAATVYQKAIDTLKQIDRPGLTPLHGRLNEYGFSFSSVKASEEALVYARKWLEGEVGVLKSRMDLFAAKKGEVDRCLHAGFLHYGQLQHQNDSFWRRCFGKISCPRKEKADDPVESYQLVRPRLPLLEAAVLRPLEAFLPREETIDSALSILCSQKSTRKIGRVVDTRSCSVGSFSLESISEQEPCVDVLPAQDPLPIAAPVVLEDSSEDVLRLPSDCLLQEGEKEQSATSSLFTPPSSLEDSLSSDEDLIYFFPDLSGHVSRCTQQFRLAMSARYFSYFSRYQEGVVFEEQLKGMLKGIEGRKKEIFERQSQLIALKQKGEGDVLAFEQSIDSCILEYLKLSDKIKRFQDERSAMNLILVKLSKMQIDKESIDTLDGLRFSTEDIRMLNSLIERVESLKLSMEATDKEVKDFADFLASWLNEICYFLEDYKGNIGYVGWMFNAKLWSMDYLKKRLSALRNEAWERDPSQRLADQESLERRIVF